MLKRATVAKPAGGKRTISIVSTIVSICLVLFLYGLLGLFLIKAKDVKREVKESIELKVIFRKGITKSEATKWQTILAGRHYVKSAKLVSEEEALDRMKANYGQEAVDVLDVNPLPMSIELNVIESFANVSQLDGLKNEIEKDPQVREVVYQENIVAEIDRNMRRVTIGIGLFVVVFLLIAVALINSTIRLTMYSRRFLIKSMQLVGATRTFIRRPFVMQSIVNGLLSGVMALSMLLALLYLVQQQIPGLMQSSDAYPVGLLFASVLALGFIISAISSYFAINRYLNLKLEELY